MTFHSELQHPVVPEATGWLHEACAAMMALVCGALFVVMIIWPVVAPFM
jgi:hypothetical protein